MKFKELCKKKIGVFKSILVISIAMLLCIISITFSVIYIMSKSAYTYAAPVEKNEIISNLKSNIDIMNILEKNTSRNYHEEYFIEEKDIEYLTTYQDNPDLPKGMVQVLQEGRDGAQNITTKKVYEDNVLVEEAVISTEIVKAAIDKVVQVGTSKYKSNYNVKVGDTLYVTSDTLGVLEVPNQDAERFLTIHKNTPVELLEIKNDWYKIAYNMYVGYCPANCLTYLKPYTKIEQDQGQEGIYSKEQLIARLDFNMELNSPSGLTLEQFRTALSNNEKDKNKIFENNADYFYYIEKQYNINGIFVAALGIHESGWGTSSIAINKRNLFGYGAYDRDPYNNAYSYAGYPESIDLIARVLVKYYLNPSGTSIYDGQIASGSYYHGSTLSGVNTKYATDKNWANSVYYWMKVLYNNL